MKAFYSVLFFTLISFHANSQFSIIDSLKTELQSKQQADSFRFRILNSLSYELCKSNPEEGLLYADSAYTLAQKLKVPKYEQEALLSRADNLEKSGKDSSAMMLYSQLLESCSKTGNRYAMANIYQRISIVNFNRADYHTALDYLNKAIILFSELKDTTRLAGCYNSVGVNQMRLGNYPEAIESYLKAEAIFEKTNNPEYFAMVSSNIGLVYSRMEEFEKDLEYQQKAYRIYQQVDNKFGMINCLGNLGNTYDNLDNLDRALEFYNRSIVMGKEFNFPRNVASGLTNSAGVFIQQSRYKEAAEALTQAVPFYEKAGDKSAAAVAYGNLARMYDEATVEELKKAGLKFTDKNAEAEKYFRLALQSAKDAADKTQIYRGLTSLSSFFETKKDFKNAFDFYKQSIVMRDSIQSDRKKKEIERLQMQAEFDKREALLVAEHEKEQALSEAEVNQAEFMRKVYASGGILLAAGGILLFVQYKRRRDAMEKKHDALLQAEITETEMKALRSQMNPHFIFNALNSINDSIQKLDTEKASYFTIRFAKLMRMVLENSEQKEITLRDELAALEMYLQVEKLRLDNKFDYSILVDENIDSDNLFVPPLILQPFAENSIWHGITPKAGRGKINIVINKENDMLRCIIEDDGIGRAKTNGNIEPGRQSLGMKITADRIKLLNKLRNTHASFHISDKEQGVHAEISLPLLMN